MTIQEKRNFITQLIKNMVGVQDVEYVNLSKDAQRVTISDERKGIVDHFQNTMISNGGFKLVNRVDDECDCTVVLEITREA